MHWRRREIRWALVLLGAALTALSACGQAPAPPAESSPETQGVEAPVPTPVSDALTPEPRRFLRGINAGVYFAGVHDSSDGWYGAMTSVVSYTFSRRYSADITVPLYLKRLVLNPDAAARTTQRLVPTGTDIGDLLLEGHASFFPRFATNTLTGLMTLPTGDRSDGVGTGRVTFDFDDRLDRLVRTTDFFVDLGAGDASGIDDRVVTEDSTSLGPSAQFQAGVVGRLPLNLTLQSFAYEQLPLGDQKTYTTLTRPGLPTATVPSGRRVLEDNGFNTTLFVPLTPHLTLTGLYNRSLRLHLDTVSAGITFVLKGSALRRRPSLVDRAMEEAERGEIVSASTPQQQK